MDCQALPVPSMLNHKCKPGRPPDNTTVPSSRTRWRGSTERASVIAMGSDQVLPSSWLHVCPYGRNAEIPEPPPLGRNTHIKGPSLSRHSVVSPGPSRPSSLQFSSAMVERTFQLSPSSDSAVTMLNLLAPSKVP